jgi:sugar phosphate isomerase/epimerase
LWDRALDVRARKRQKYFDQVCRTLEAIAPKARQLRLKLGLETRWGIEEIPDADETAQLIARFGDDVIAYWHDTGHAAMKEHLGLICQETILKRFRGRTAGMHLQDFSPPASDHRPPGRGTLDFSRLAPFVTEEMVLAWEIHPDCPAAEITGAVQVAHEQLKPRATA